MRHFFIFIFILLLSHTAIAGESNPSLMGATTCSSSNCHGATTANADQFTKWATLDKHSKAYSVLFEKRSVDMAKRLGAESAVKSEFCLTCHATFDPAIPKGPKYDVSEGVGCESCHGAAFLWLEPHTRKGWSHAQNVALGLADQKKLNVRAQNCLRCHGGLDHKTYAAGHPELTFELDTFSALMPQHWKTRQNWEGAKAWATGQAIYLRDSFKTLQEHLAKKSAPDESDKNCVSCHHNLYDSKWSIGLYAQGHPTFNESHWIIFRPFLSLVYPDLLQKLDDPITQIGQAFTREPFPADQARMALAQILPVFDDLIAQINTFEWTPALAQKCMDLIVSQPQIYEGSGGFRTAEQGVMALDSIQLSLNRVLKKPGGQSAGIQKLYKVLDVSDPSRYNSQLFIKTLKELKPL